MVVGRLKDSYRMVIGWLVDGYRLVIGWLQACFKMGYRIVIGWLQNGHRQNLAWLLNCYRMIFVSFYIEQFKDGLRMLYESYRIISGRFLDCLWMVIGWLQDCFRMVLEWFQDYCIFVIRWLKNNFCKQFKDGYRMLKDSSRMIGGRFQDSYRMVI